MPDLLQQHPPRLCLRLTVYLQGQPFNITLIQVYAPTTEAKEAEVDRFYDDLQDLLELTLKKDILFLIRDWSAN